MKKALLIILALSPILILSQTFDSFKDLVSFQKEDKATKELYLKSRGYSEAGSGVLNSKEATDTTCVVWLSSDSMEIVRINDESVEYEWLYSRGVLNVEVNKLFDRYSTNISTAMFDTKREYLFLKRKKGITFSKYDDEYDKEFRPYDYSYIKKDDVYIRSKLWFNYAFVGSISE